MSGSHSFPPKKHPEITSFRFRLLLKNTVFGMLLVGPQALSSLNSHLKHHNILLQCCTKKIESLSTAHSLFRAASLPFLKRGARYSTTVVLQNHVLLSISRFRATPSLGLRAPCQRHRQKAGQTTGPLLGPV